MSGRTRSLTALRFRWGVVAILGVGAVLRIAHLAVYRDLPFFEHHRLDALLYHEAALRLAGGDWAMGSEVLHMSPLYSYLLGGIYSLLGAGPWGIRLMQLVLGLATIALVAAATRRLYGAIAGLVAGAAAALYGPFIFYEVQLSVATLATFLTAGLIWQLVVAFDDRGGHGDAWWRSVPSWVGIGATVGLAVLARPNALLLLGPIGLVAVLRAARTGRWGPWIARLGVAVVVAAAVIAPATIRNAVVAGEPVLVTDSGGLNFYLGNGPGAIGTFRIPPEMPEARNAREQFEAFRTLAEQDAGRPLSSREVDDFWFGRTWEHVQRKPLQWVALLGEKAWLFWSARELPNTHDYAFHREIDAVLALPLVQFGWIAPWALLGTVLLLWAGRAGERLVGLVNLTYFAAIVLFFVLSHYRLPAIPGLMIAAAGAGVWVGRALRMDGRARLAGALLIVAALAWYPVVHAEKLPLTFADEYFKLGYAYHRQDRLVSAEEAYLRSLAIDATNASAHKNVAYLYEQIGQRERALTHWVWVARIAAEQGDRENMREAAAARERLARP